MPKASLLLFHHTAATGGTLLTRMLGSAPGTIVTNEVHPFRNEGFVFDTLLCSASVQNLYGIVPRPQFLNHFVRDLKFILEIVGQHASRLIVRIHSHTDFFDSRGDKNQRWLIAIRESFPVAEVASIRNPLESYLSCKRKAFIPKRMSLEAYLETQVQFVESLGAVPVFEFEEVMDSLVVRSRFLQSFGIDGQLASGLLTDMNLGLALSGDRSDPGIIRSLHTAEAQSLESSLSRREQELLNQFRAETRNSPSTRQ